MAGTNTTEALVVHRLDAPFKLETIEFGEIRPNEALVEIHYTGICHSDIKAASGKMRIKPPFVPGHEGAGVILKAGNDLATEFRPGDIVLLSYAFCGACPDCTANDPAYCENLTRLNFSGLRDDGTSTLGYATTPATADDGDGSNAPDILKGSFFGQSCFAKRAVVHHSSLVKVPPDTPLALFAPLGCGLQTGAGAVLDVLDVGVGSSLAVFGVGAVGLSAVMAGKMRGASTIVAVDLHPGRLELARRLGATHTILGGPEVDVVARIVALCPPFGVKFAVDCSGVPGVVENMIDSLGTRGHGLTIGSPGPGPRAGISIVDHLIRGRKYSGSHQGDSRAKEMIPYLVDQYRQGNYPIEQLITTYDYTDYEKALADLHAGETVKAVLKWK